MSLTEEQKKIIDQCVESYQGGNPDNSLIKISAVAGS